MDTVQPALTPDEWRIRSVLLNAGGADEVEFIVNDAQRVPNPDESSWLAERRGLRIDTAEVNGATATVSPTDIPKVIALANHALPEQHPFKFTHEDVALLDSFFGKFDPDDEDEAAIGSLRDRIAALLPPTP